MPFPGVWPFDTTNYCHLPRSHLRITKFYKKKKITTPPQRCLFLYLFYMWVLGRRWRPLQHGTRRSRQHPHIVLSVRFGAWFTLVLRRMHATVGHARKNRLSESKHDLFQSRICFSLSWLWVKHSGQEVSLVSSSSCERHRRQAPRLEWPPRAWGSYTPWSLPYNLCSQSVR